MIRRLWILPAVLGLMSLLMPVTAATAAAYVPLNGDGSSWAGPAIDQFGKDVRNQGIVINFNPDGSAVGRGNYAQGEADFAATDIAYLNSPDPFGAQSENYQNVAFSYIPIVAGGTTFLYNLTVGGRKITDMRLSGDTITKIFTGQITNWNDPRITHDYGRALPSQKITVITRADGSGATYQFTRWMAHEYASQWAAFCTSHGGQASNCGPTENYPGFAGSQQRNGSDQVANYISAASYGEGSIGYDEYAYALQSGISVVKLLNPAGYYTLPSPSNVAIALQAAQIDEDPNSVTFLIQNLDNVYTNKDPRSYPLSSYSYLIVPRDTRTYPGGHVAGPPSLWNNDKGKTLSTWLNYVLCGAQQKAGNLGYSPLPKNLVVGGFQQNGFIPGHVGIPNLDTLQNCDNPTYSNGVNLLIKNAPFPSPCDKVTAALTCGTASAGTGTGRTGGGGTTTGGGTRSGGTTTAPAVPGATRSTTAARAGGGAVDPDTGTQAGGTGDTGTNPNVYAQPVSVTGSVGNSGLFASLAAVEVAGAILIPGLLGAWLTRRRRSGL